MARTLGCLQIIPVHLPELSISAMKPRLQNFLRKSPFPGHATRGRSVLAAGKAQ